MLRPVPGGFLPRHALATVGLTGALALGCATWGPEDPTQRANARACASYAATLNEQIGACGLQYDPDNLCSSASYPSVDMAPYYACLVEHTRCEGAELVLEVDGCEPPLVALTEPAGAPASPETDEAALRSVEEEGHR